MALQSDFIGLFYFNSNCVKFLFYAYCQRFYAAVWLLLLALTSPPTPLYIDLPPYLNEHSEHVQKQKGKPLFCIEFWIAQI